MTMWNEKVIRAEQAIIKSEGELITALKHKDTFKASAEVHLKTAIGTVERILQTAKANATIKELNALLKTPDNYEAVLKTDNPSAAIHAALIKSKAERIIRLKNMLFSVPVHATDTLQILQSMIRDELVDYRNLKEDSKKSGLSEKHVEKSTVTIEPPTKNWNTH